MNITQYWLDILSQNADAIRGYFHPDAKIYWHNTNECFTVDEFIRANCEYPGDWSGEIEHLICAGDTLVTATHVYTKDQKLHFHAVSFIRIKNAKVVSIDEYWGDDAEAPQWRKNLNIGTPIRSTDVA